MRNVSSQLPETADIQFVALGADPFRRDPKGGWAPAYNVRILEVLAAAALPGLPVVVADPDWFGVPVESGPDAAARWMGAGANALTPDVMSRIAELRGGVYLGFETPDWLWPEIVSVCAIAIDVRLHPVRFGSDLLFLVRSGGVDWPEEVAAEIAEWLALEVALLRFRGQGPGAKSSFHRDAVLALQIAADSALLSHGRFARITDHIDDLRDWAEKFRRVYVAPHPLGPPDPEALSALVSLPNVWFSARNTYGLLTDPDVAAVSAISSSVLHEAQLLGLDVKAWRPDLSHGFPVRDEYRPAELADVVEALRRQVTGWGLPLRSRNRLPGVRAFFGQVGTNTSQLSAPADPEILGPGEVPVVGAALSSNLTYGWSVYEDWGRWMSEPVACLDLCWPEGHTAPLTITLQMHVLFSADGPTDDIEVWSRGERLTTMALTAQPEAPVSMTFSLSPPIADDRIQIQIVKLLGVCPARAHGTGDNRNLRLGLLSVAVSGDSPA